MADSTQPEIDLLRRIARGTVLSIPVLGAYVEQVVFGTLDDRKRAEKAKELRRLFDSVAGEQQQANARIETVLQAVLDQSGAQ